MSLALTPLQEKVSALFLCAEIFLEPSKRTVEYLKALKELIPSLTCNTEEISSDELEAEYIQLFSVGSKSYNTVPLASWWLNGVMMGESVNAIELFYEEAGFQADIQTIKLPSDHVGLMLMFVAILCEEERFEEAEIFVKSYLAWLPKLVDSIVKVNADSIFVNVLKISHGILTTLKEGS